MIENESILRLTVFFGMLGIIGIAEFWLPRRAQPSRRRWIENFSLVVLDTLLLRLLVPAGAVGAAIWATSEQYGLLHQLILPDWIKIAIAWVILDAAIYFQHRIFHAVPVLWRLHRLHHTDIEFDFTTAVRFHPLEILLSLGIKVAIIVLLGAPAEAVILFEIVLNGAAVFNHANLRLPLSLDRILRLLIVTPDMHRIHHSVIREETDSNFGFSVSIWDRLFGSYRAEPKGDHTTMPIGIERFRSAREQRIDQLLIQPFR